MDSKFIYKPPKNSEPNAVNSMGVKFSVNRYILDDWWLFGGTRWTRMKFRLKHPVVYSKRGIRSLYRRIKRIFVKPKLIHPVVTYPSYEDEK